MDSNDLEREKGITILAKNTAVSLRRREDQHRRHARPRRLRRRGRARADDGRRRAAARRRVRGPAAADALRAAQGARARLPVDPRRQQGRPPDARIAEVVDEVYELFLDLDADETRSSSRSSTANAQGRRARSGSTRTSSAPDLEPLFETAARARSPRRRTTPRHPLQALVTNLDASPYVGRLALCRVLHGTIRKGQQVAWCRADGTDRAASRSPSSTSPRRSTACRPTRPARARSSPSPASPSHDRRDARRPDDPRPLPVITSTSRASR
jgi:GTP-binding protein